MGHGASDSRYHSSGNFWFLLTCDCFAVQLMLLVAPGSERKQQGRIQAGARSSWKFRFQRLLLKITRVLSRRSNHPESTSASRPPFCKREASSR